MWRSEFETDKTAFNTEHLHKSVQDMENVSKVLSEDSKSDDELDQAWREWEKTFDATEDSIMLIDTQFNIIQCNISTSNFLGKPLEEIIGNTCCRLVHETDSPPKECPLKKAIYSKKHEQIEIYLPERDIWVEISADPILDKNRNIDKIVHILRDITYRKKSEQALHRSEERFKDIVYSIGDLIWEVDENMVFTYCSEGTQKILGYPVTQVIGKTFCDFMQPEEAKRIGSILKDLFQSNKPIKNLQGCYIRKDGKERYLLTNGVPILNEKGDLTGYRGVCKDITSHKKVEQTILKEKDKAQKYLDVAGVMIIAIDSENRVGMINKKGCDILGYKEEEIIGKNWLNNFVPERKRNEIKDILEKIWKQKPKIREFCENPILTKDNQERLIAWHNTILKDENGNIFAILSSGEDITDQKKAETALKESEKHYRLLAEQMSDGLTHVDENGIKIYVNQKAAEIFGCKPEQMTGRHWSEFYDQDAQKIIKEELQLRKKGTIRSYEVMNTTKDGRRIYLRISPQAIFDDNGRYKGSISIITDITDRKKAEDNLQQSEEKFFKAFHSGPYIVAITSLKDGKLIEVNNSYTRVTGYTREEVIGHNTHELGIWIKSEERSRLYQKLMEHGQIRNEEATIHIKSGEIRTLSLSADLINIGGQKCMISVAADITERKKAEEAQQREHNLLRLLIDNIPDRIYVKDNKHRFILGNDTVVKYEGLQCEEELLGKTDFDLYPKELAARFHAQEQKIIQNCQPLINHEGLYVDKQGNNEWTLATKVPLRDEKGNVIGIVGITRDITERKKAEEALQESEGKLKNIVENSTNLFYSYTPEHILTYLSPQVKDILGYKPDEAMLRWTELASDNPINKEGFKLTVKAIETGKPQPPYELELVHKNGKKVWVEIREAPVVVNKKTISIVGALTDITERKRAQEALAESEQRFRAIFDKATDGILLADMENRKFYTGNKMICQMLGYNLEELRKLGVTDIHPQKDLPHVFDEFENQSKEIYALAREILVQRKDGSVFYADVNSSPVELAGKKYLIGIFRDITERKRSEQALDQERYKLREYFENLPALAYNITFDGTIADCNQVSLKILGYESKDDLIGKPLLTTIYPPSSRRKAQQLFEKWKKEGKLRNEEIQIVTKQGEIIDVLLNVTTIFDHNGIPVHGLSTQTVITERKKAEENLRESEAILRRAQIIGQIGDWNWNPVTNKLYWSEQVFRILQMEPRDMDIDLMNSVVHPDDKDRLLDAANSTLNEHQPFSIDLRMIRPDDSIVWIHDEAEIVYDAEGKPVHMFGVIQDITERKQIENIARDREAKLTSIFKVAPIAIGLISNRIILQVNNRMCETLGYTSDELIGKNSRILYSNDKDYKYVGQEKYRQIREYGTGTVGTKWKCKNGQIIDIILSSTPLDPSDLSKGVTFTALDITQRKKAEQKLLTEQSRLKALASELTLTEERERRRLAIELHDEIGQLLAISKMRTEAILKSRGNKKVKSELSEISKMLDTAITETRGLTFDLSSPILYTLGFEAAVSEWLNEQIRKKYEIQTEFEDDGQPKPLDNDILVLLFRNVRELLFNVVKHAGAKNIKVSVKKIGEQILVAVEDNGIGFEYEEVSQIPNQTRGFGLFSIRQRLEELGGQLEIESQVGKGTTVRMTAPLIKK